jgi:hypothetical protein
MQKNVYFCVRSLQMIQNLNQKTIQNAKKKNLEK